VSGPITPEDAAFIRSRVIYEDAALLGFDKPAGLSSQGGSPPRRWTICWRRSPSPTASGRASSTG